MKSSNDFYENKANIWILFNFSCPMVCWFAFFSLKLSWWLTLFNESGEPCTMYIATNESNDGFKKASFLRLKANGEGILP